MPTVTSNKQLDVINAVQKHINSSFSASLVAVCILDEAQHSLQITIEFESIQDMDDFANHCIAVWRRYIPIPVAFTDNKLPPSNISDFAGKKRLIYYTNDENGYLFYIYRFSEDGCRVLKFCHIS